MSKITFTERAFAEYLYWQSQDKKTLKRINALLKDISRSPYEGIGKPDACTVSGDNVTFTRLPFAS